MSRRKDEIVARSTDIIDAEVINEASPVAYEDVQESILPEYEDAIENAYVVAGAAVPKDELLNVPFAIYDYDFRQGNIFVDTFDHDKEMTYAFGGIPDRETGEMIESGNKREFVIVRAVTAPGHLRKPNQPGFGDAESEHVVFVDGGTGIYKSLREFHDARVRKGMGKGMIRCRRGLRVSTYTGPQGSDSETWYLS